MKFTLITTMLFLSLLSFGQTTISVKIKLDEVSVDSLTNDLIVKLKFKNESDTLTIKSVNGKVHIPWIYKEIVFFEVVYKRYFVNMSAYAAQVEGKSLFNERIHNWFIIIDNFPYSTITKEKFTKIIKPEYSFIIKTDHDYNFNGIGRK